MPPKDQNAAPSRSAGEKQARDERQRECAEVDDDYWNLLKDRKFVRWDSGMACRTQEARDNRVDDSAEDHRKRINEQEKQVDEAAEGARNRQPLESPIQYKRSADEEIPEGQAERSKQEK